MSDTTVLVLLVVALMGGCVVACVLIGRHYARKSARAARYSVGVYRRLTKLVQDFEREQNWTSMDTEVTSRVPLLSTHGQKMRARGRNAFSDATTEETD